MIGRTSRKGIITLREEIGLKVRTKHLTKVNLQRKETLIKTRNVFIRRRFSVSNVKSLDILHLNVGLVREIKPRMTWNKLRLHKMIKILIHYC